MRRPIAILLTAAVLGAAAAAREPQQAAPAARLTAADVARRVQDRDTGRDARQTLRMKLVDRRGRVRERVLQVLLLRAHAGRGGADGDRLLIRFLYPNDIRGTGLLVWEHPAGEDERFLYLPSLGRVRRIAATEAQDSFVGTDFTYEDIGGREFDDYTYAFAGGDGENTAWTPPGGGPPRPAWRLESKRRDGSARFSRVVSLILKDSFVVVQAEIFNRRDERHKTYAVGRLERVQDIWTVMRSEMANLQEKTSTTLEVDKVEYNVGLELSDFSRRELERSPGGAD